MDLPPKYLPTLESSSEYKATTADNTIFWVEKFSLSDNGDNLQFWVDAVKNDFVENRGYVLISEDPTKTGNGLEGQRLVFETTTQGQSYRYMLALFIERGWLSHSLVTMRLTAPSQSFEARATQIDTAIAKYK